MGSAYVRLLLREGSTTAKPRAFWPLRRLARYPGRFGGFGCARRDVKKPCAGRRSEDGPAPRCPIDADSVVLVCNADCCRVQAQLIGVNRGLESSHSNIDVRRRVGRRTVLVEGLVADVVVPSSWILWIYFATLEIEITRIRCNSATNSRCRSNGLPCGRSGHGRRARNLAFELGAGCICRVTKPLGLQEKKLVSAPDIGATTVTIVRMSCTKCKPYLGVKDAAY